MRRDAPPNEALPSAALPYLGNRNPASGFRHDLTGSVPTLAKSIVEAVEKIGKFVPREKTLAAPVRNNLNIPFAETAASGLEAGTLELLTNCLGYIQEFVEKEQAREGVATPRKTSHRPIVLVRDGCFTNDLLEEELRSILGKEGFKRFVSVQRIDWDEDRLDEAGAMYRSSGKRLLRLQNHSVILLGGSLSDAYSIPPAQYGSSLVEDIWKAMDGEPDDMENNRRLLGICFGNQLMANLAGIKRGFPAPCLTVRGAAQFGPVLCYPDPGLSRASEVAKQALNGLVKHTNGKPFWAVLTRTGVVAHNALAMESDDSPLQPLLRDADGRFLAWKYGNAIGVQPHFEIGPHNARRAQEGLVGNEGKRDDSQGVKEVGALAKALGADYGVENVTKMVEGFAESILGMEGGEASALTSRGFFLNALMTLSANVWSVINAERPEAPATWEKAESAVRAKIADRLIESAYELGFSTPNDAWESARQLARSFLLEPRTLEDWRVDRGIAQVSQVLGVRLDGLIPGFCAGAKAAGEKGPLSFVDIGAGNGALLRDVRALRGKSRDLVVYGMADRIYYEVRGPLRQALVKEGKAPEEAAELLIQTVLEEYRECEKAMRGRQTNGQQDPLELMHLLAAETELFPERGLAVHGMFSDEGRKPLSRRAKAFLDEGMLAPGSELRQKAVAALRESFLVPQGQDIYVSDFQNFRVPEATGLPVHLCTASRSTSHAGGRTFYKVLRQYLKSQAGKWSLRMDNGVHASYTGILRIWEIARALEDSGQKDAWASLVFDPARNYVRCAVLGRGDTARILAENLEDGCKMISLKEAESCTFFRFESFLRRTFRAQLQTPSWGNQAFQDSTPQIKAVLDHALASCFRSIPALSRLTGTGSFLRRRPGKFQNKDKETLATLALDLINDAVARERERGRGHLFKTISRRELMGLEDDTGASLSQILDGPVVVPSWLNPDAVRQY